MHMSGNILVRTDLPHLHSVFSSWRDGTGCSNYGVWRGMWCPPAVRRDSSCSRTACIPAPALTQSCLSEPRGKSGWLTICCGRLVSSVGQWASICIVKPRLFQPGVITVHFVSDPLAAMWCLLCVCVCVVFHCLCNVVLLESVREISSEWWH
jgi:hypothetical protein